MKEKPRIVVVEDDDILAEFMTKRLELSNMEVVRYSNGLDAVSGIVTATQKIDLILLDISLPGIDGLEVLQRIEPFQKEAHIPVVMLSNFSQEADIDWGQKFGVRKFVNKVSVTPVEIVEMATEILADAARKAGSGVPQD